MLSFQVAIMLDSKMNVLTIIHNFPNPNAGRGGSTTL